MLSVQFVNSQLYQLGVVEPKPRPEHGHLLHRFQIEVSADMLEPCATTWGRSFGRSHVEFSGLGRGGGLGWFRHGQPHVLEEIGGLVQLIHAAPLCTCASVLTCNVALNQAQSAAIS